MSCRRNSDLGCLSPAADYLTRPVANDNRPPRPLAERIVTALGMFACLGLQILWSSVIFAQLQG